MGNHIDSAVIFFRRGKRVLLRPIEREDAPVLRRWMNDPDTTRYLMCTFPLMEKQEEDWIDQLAANERNIVLGIATAEHPHMLIGTIGLHRIDLIHRNAVTGTVIGEKNYRSKGYGTEAKMLLLDFAFNTLGLYTIVSQVMSSNNSSLAYSAKCGYEQVGRIPNMFRCQNGERCDEVILAVTRKKWRALWMANKQKYLPDM